MTQEIYIFYRDRYKLAQRALSEGESIQLPRPEGGFIKFVIEEPGEYFIHDEGSVLAQIIIKK